MFPIKRIQSLFTGVLFLAVCLGCSGDDGADQQPSGEEILGAAAIGAAGGRVEGDEIALVVPAGAFDVETSVSIRRSSANPDGSAERGYRIEGLPANYASALEVRLPGTARTRSSLATVLVGEEVFTSLDGARSEWVYAHRPLALDESSGELILVLPATPPAVPGRSAEFAGETIDVEVLRTEDASTMTSDAGHFEIKWTDASVPVQQVEALVGFLEEDYDRFLAMGFSYSGRTRWPVEVTLLPLADEVFGLYGNSSWGDDYGSINVNRNKMSELVEMRSTAGHEFFHLVQSLYDSRWAYSQAKFAPAHHWLNEACSVWSEAGFTDDPENYQSAARPGNAFTPFTGLMSGYDDDGTNHGYGLSGLVAHVVGEYGEAVLVDVYESIRDGLSAAGAIETNTADFGVWWGEFLESYLLADYYPIEMANVLGEIAATFTVADPGDQTWSSNFSLPDLSGRIFRVMVSDDELPAGASIEFTVDDPFADIFVLSYGTGGLAAETSGSGTVLLTGLADFPEISRHLLVLVTNSRAVSPYDELRSLTLAVEVIRPGEGELAYTHFEIRWTMNTVWHGDSGWESDGFIGDGLEFFGDGAFAGTVGTFAVDHMLGDDLHFAGAFTATLGPALDEVTAFSGAYTLTRLSPASGEREILNETSISGGGVPVYFQHATEARYGIMGVAACDAVESAFQRDHQFEQETVGYSCDEASNLEIRFRAP